MGVVLIHTERRTERMTDGRMDGQNTEGNDEAIRSFLKLCERAKKREKCGEFNSVINEKSKISFSYREDVSSKFSEILTCLYQTSFNAV